jgi:hypothetical protein
MAVVKVIVDFLTMLIGAEGAKTPAGVRGRGDPAGAKSAEEAPRNARGKRSAWSGNQRLIKKLAMYQLLAYNKKNILF